jgi:hypothetical protein
MGIQCPEVDRKRFLASRFGESEELMERTQVRLLNGWQIESFQTDIQQLAVYIHSMFQHFQIGMAKGRQITFTK